MGTNPGGSRSSDGITDWTKKGKQRRLRGGVEQGTKHGELDQRQTHMEREQWMTSVRKLDLSHLCFSSNFYFSMSLSISLYVSLTNLFPIILFPYLLITRDTQDEGEARFRFY